MGDSLHVLVVTVSDRASRGEYEDLSGPAVEAELISAIPGCVVERVIVPDDPKKLRRTLRAGRQKSVVITTGGTGLGPRDITPETTRKVCKKEIPGISEMLRRESQRESAMAALSRGYAGIRGQTIYVNLPGSVAGARSCTRLLAPLLTHAVSMIAGGGH